MKMKILLKNSTYDVLKWVCLIALPALATLVAALGAIWGIPHCEQIVLTINAVALFIGALIGVSSAQYNKSHENGNE